MSSLAGYFLVARPALTDPSFHRSVVLILQHGPEGAFGLIVNRPVASEKLPFPIYAGGPCNLEGMLLLHGHPDWVNDTEGQVCPGVFLGDAACAERLTEGAIEDSHRFKMFSGYAGWGAQQLECELVEKSWAVVRATSEHIFDTPSDDLWASVLPPSIPEPSLN